MSSSWTRAFGLSMTVCLLAIVAAPALATGPSNGRIVSPASIRGPGVSIAGRGLSLFTSLEALAIPVVGPLALASGARSLVQRFLPRTGQAPSSFVNSHPGLVSRFMDRSAVPVRQFQPGFAAEAMSVGLAGNLTSYLAGKGYDVADLDAAVSVARNAQAASNLTALRSAMMTFRTDLGNKISAGTINRSVIRDFLGTQPVIRQFARRGMPVKGMSPMARRGR